MTSGLADVAEEPDGETDLGGQQIRQGEGHGKTVTGEPQANGHSANYSQLGNTIGSSMTGVSSVPGSRRVSHDANELANQKVCQPLAW